MSVLIFLPVVFLGFPLTVTLATPARYLKFYLLWLAMLAVLAVVWPSGADHSRFAGLGELLEAAWLGISICRCSRGRTASWRRCTGGIAPNTTRAARNLSANGFPMRRLARM